MEDANKNDEVAARMRTYRENCFPGQILHVPIMGIIQISGRQETVVGVGTALLLTRDDPLCMIEHAHERASEQARAHTHIRALLPSVTEEKLSVTRPTLDQHRGQRSCGSPLHSSSL